MKKLIAFIICSFLIIDILDSSLLDNYIHNSFKNIYNDNNKYNIVVNTDALNNNTYVYKEYSNLFKNTTNFYPSDRQGLLNIYYTVLNNGYGDFSYYCDENYTDCLNDINKLSNDADTFTYMNQLVHPYNSFSTISSKYNSNERIDVDIEKKYTKEDIKNIEDKLNQIVDELNINSYSSVEDKIRVFHDYIINTNKYDQERANNGESNYHSDSAIGTLFEGYSICSGYSDTMAIFLNKMGIENVKVVSEKHAWNAVKLNDNWYHIDLTWDDPIINTGEEVILHDYFIITTDELQKKDMSEHDFNKELYNFIN